ncbi:hypothetical protein ACFV6Z_26425 [Streptomyces sp. NPDC059818]|uniref:hypothetical protein n=1 Tax=Streptomyces sp. NPDC059818 TaxID=3346962 RepID=UPI003664DD01
MSPTEFIPSERESRGYGGGQGKDVPLQLTPMWVKDEGKQTAIDTGFVVGYGISDLEAGKNIRNHVNVEVGAMNAWGRHAGIRRRRR